MIMTGKGQHIITLNSTTQAVHKGLLFIGLTWDTIAYLKRMFSVVKKKSIRWRLLQK